MNTRCLYEFPSFYGIMMALNVAPSLLCCQPKIGTRKMYGIYGKQRKTWAFRGIRRKWKLEPHKGCNTSLMWRSSCQCFTQKRMYENKLMRIFESFAIPNYWSQEKSGHCLIGLHSLAKANSPTCMRFIYKLIHRETSTGLSKTNVQLDNSYSKNSKKYGFERVHVLRKQQRANVRLLVLVNDVAGRESFINVFTAPM